MAAQNGTLGTVRIVLTSLGLLFGLVAGGLGSAAVGSSMYNKLEDRFDTHESAQHMDELREENRLATIEEQLKNTNKLLEEIRDELKER